MSIVRKAFDKLLPSAQLNLQPTCNQLATDCISRQALCEYALNQKNKSVTPNDIMRFQSAEPDDVPDTNVGDMVSRRFVELLAEYHDPELCPYKEYKGKPYFSIKYIENGEGYIGYGTYSPKVLSRYLREYFIEPEQTRTQMSLSNCISRQAAIDGLKLYIDDNGIFNQDRWFVHGIRTAITHLMRMPSTEPEPKTGEWNFDGNQMYECTNCGVAYTEYQFEKMRVRYDDPKFPKFCPDCGSYNGGDSDDQQ